ncbi:phosphohistidine phosphatase SixA [Microbulbifer sp. TYP-18]|uniref:phosphohistidine phosphatase SixA n=1 Tax=Microbulbifer sp. TYP-18 TaxID=3230024 RepID=UPI0034C5D916
MQLFILRHGQAEPLELDDAARQLTARGRAQVNWVCDRRRRELASVRTIWASPYQRARQTAQIVADHLQLPVHIQELLTGDTPPQRVLEALAGAGPFPLLLASHQPLVGSLVNGLCGSGGAHPMGTASLACLSADVWANGCAGLDWLQHAEP